MDIWVLSSGSAGNAALFHHEGTWVLIDAGISPRRIRQRAKTLNVVVPDRLDAVFVTHAHGDHARYGGACARTFDAPLYMTPATERGAKDLVGARTRIIAAQSTLRIGTIDVDTLPTPHDAPQIGLTLSAGTRRVGFATDLGEIPAALVERFMGCDTLLIESNHDALMLQAGPYPPHLKSHVASGMGHLSNAQTAALIAQTGPTLKTLVLMHLSERNNTQALARDTAAAALKCRPHQTPVQLLVAQQHAAIALHGALA